MENSYIIPEKVQIGHVHFKVSNLNRSLAFYCDLLGFEVMQLYGKQAAFISAGGYHHHIGLNTWHSKGAENVKLEEVGLYHAAILYPTRKDLATILKRLIEKKVPVSGASDHGVSEAIYLNDPDGNGLELYWDKPKDHWPITEDGMMEMFTRPLDIENLLGELSI